MSLYPPDGMGAAYEQQSLKREYFDAVREEQAPKGEPKLGQLDSNLIAIILSNCTEERFVLNGKGELLIHPDTGKPIKDIVTTRPDIYNYVMDLSHLIRTSYLEPEKARFLYFEYKKSIRRSKARYRTNAPIMDLLAKIQTQMFVIAFGDAEGGRRQRYLATTIKGVQIVQENSDSKPWWRRSW